MFPTTVIAAIDLSTVSDVVCEKACALVGSSGGQVHLVHALSLSELSESALRTGGALHEAHSAAERALRKLAEPYSASGRVGQLIVREGDATSVLSKVAEQLEADLIVVDSHHRGLTRIAQGSVAEKLIGSAPCAVLVLRRG
jgi:universal stress protein A